jgi:predicted RecA/RadA family phage recombinase
MATVKGEYLVGNIEGVPTGQVAAAAMTKGTILDYLGTTTGSAAVYHSIGVLSHDVALGESTYTFDEGSIVLVQAADGSISAGDRLIPDGTEVGKATTAAAGNKTLGIALDASSAKDDWIRVKLINDAVPAA